MKRLTITDINSITISDINDAPKNSKYNFSSAVSMAAYVKKLNVSKRNYSADYATFEIELL